MFNLRVRVACLHPLRTARKTIGASKLPSYRGARWYATDKKDLDITHSRFLAEASSKTKWKDDRFSASSEDARASSCQDDLEGVTDTRGKLSPTSSHLFKLILPLGSLSHPSNTRTEPESSTNESSKQKTPHTPPTVILLHPSQPLSHVSRLILASLAPATPSISFRSISSRGQAFQWSDSTDVGDFIRDAARAAEFTICISYGPEDTRKRLLPSADQGDARIVPVISADTSNSGRNGETGITETLLTVTVPTFADRTRFLRRRLNIIEGRLHDMEGLKQECDEEANRGARKMAVGGFGMLVVYWTTVARLTFWDYGWEVMEPITYLSGLSTVILGYLWFLYQGREVSYTTVLARSISARREALYKDRGFDIERWMELVGEKKALRAEIGRIARDYEGDDEKNNHDSEDEPSRTSGDGEKTEDDIQDEGRDMIEEESRRSLNGSRNDDQKNRQKSKDMDEKDVKIDQDEQNGKEEARKANQAGL